MTELVDLVRKLQLTISVTQKQQLVELVIKKTSNTTDTAVDNLTKVFEKLSVNLVQQIQSQQPYQRPGGSYGQYPQQLYRNPPAEALNGSGPQNASGNLPSASVGAYGLSQGSGRTQGICWYCYNQNPQYQDPPHRFRERCPWYQKHLAIGTAYINENSWLAYRYP